MDSLPNREILQEYEFELLLPSGHSAAYFLGDLDPSYHGGNRGLILRNMRQKEYDAPPSVELTKEIESIPLRKGTVFSIRKATLMDITRIFHDAAGFVDNFQSTSRRGIRLQANRALAITTREGRQKRIGEVFPEESLIHGISAPPYLRRIETPRFQGMLKVDPVKEKSVVARILRAVAEARVLEFIKVGFAEHQTEFTFGPNNSLEARRFEAQRSRVAEDDRASSVDSATGSSSEDVLMARRRRRRATGQIETTVIVDAMHELRARILRAGIPACGVVTNEVLGLFGW